MISFSGYEQVIDNVYQTGNDHVFQAWDDLNQDEKKILMDDLAAVDFDLVEKLFIEKDQAHPFEFTPAPFIPVPVDDEGKQKREQARLKGLELIRSGRTAAFVVAGGQGSRLGYDGPKGKFPVGPVSGKTLFEIHGEKIKKYSEKHHVAIPWLVMTSQANHDETVAYFADMNFFGLDPSDIRIFPQNMIPSLDSEGKLMLADKNHIFKNPDGHGGSLTALATSGALDWLLERGIEVISYFQVDNPTVKIIDPVFFGHHMLGNADVSSKCLKKTDPFEKVGIFVTREDGRIAVVEYSDLPEEKAVLKDKRGELLYAAGSPAIHLFSLSFIDRVTRGDLSLPFHTARKKIKAYNDGAASEVDGYKFEKFVFDALPLTDNNVIIEALREDEFAPVKNSTGVDSVESSGELMMDLHRRWLEQAGCSIPQRVKELEIAPSLAVGPEDIDSSLEIPDQESVLLT